MPCPFRAALYFSALPSPRALPWAKFRCPLRGVMRRSRRDRPTNRGQALALTPHLCTLRSELCDSSCRLRNLYVSRETYSLSKKHSVKNASRGRVEVAFLRNADFLGEGLFLPREASLAGCRRLIAAVTAKGSNATRNPSPYLDPKIKI